MAKNKVQFQKGMSERQFVELVGTEQQYRSTLSSWRWPKGFECPQCQDKVYSEIRSRRLFQCSGGRRQVSLTAGTILHASKLPLTDWFRAMSHLRQCKNGISALAAADNPTFRWVNTLLGNLKTSLRGTFHAIARHYVRRYLAQAQYRFNRRYHLDQILPRFANAAIQTTPCPYRSLVKAEFPA